MLIGRTHLPQAAMALTVLCFAASASADTNTVVSAQNSVDLTGQDTVLWTAGSASASPAKCHDQPLYTPPARYSVQYVCGQWVLHKPNSLGPYHKIFLLTLLVIGVGVRMGGTKRS
jgi:hypothetical protein